MLKSEVTLNASFEHSKKNRKSVSLSYFKIVWSTRRKKIK